MATLDFKGKSIIQNYHMTVKYHELVPQKAKSLTDKVSLNDNLIIHGDNLKALKALLPMYAGKVKCIYIDPPYNTGNENWAYNDNVNSPMMQEWLGKTVDREDLTKSDKWLCLLAPRLKLLRDLLSNEGIIFVSIDDIEVNHLRLLMDDVFGETQFLAQFIWKSRQIIDSRNQNKVSIDHEYVLCYSKTKDIPLRGKFSDKTKYSNPDNDPKGPWMSNSILGLATAEGRPNLHYDLIDPKTKIVYPCPPESGWRYSKESIKRKIEEGRIIFPAKGGRPREKKYLDELADEFTGFSSVLPIEAGYTLHGTRELREILGTNQFDFPKPHTLIRILLEQATNKNSIILDSFAGSGTTAHAVLDLNKEDGGNRKFILIECEAYADTLTAERVRRVIKGVPKSSDEKLKNGLGGSFSYFELGRPIEMDGILSGKSLPSYKELARYVFYTATGEEFNEKAVDEKKQ
ncbi:MAG: site-specific DNA-methyltransferase, partial [Candidatus Paceibacterota bacterium]